MLALPQQTTGAANTTPITKTQNNKKERKENKMRQKLQLH